MNTNNGSELEVIAGEGICSNDLFWVTIKLRQDNKASEAMMRPAQALKIGISIIGSALKGLLLKK
jgi:hypothetical protein